ncbi:NAD-dependent succinate-semialdehyde dehydrogenase [Enterovibrio calviensis]|uniref:NAD-dependent succinate-semialdehyde dehydrogenase n=1 Tax=Enterovibrio calviensis TaxID=91359 RepID=UPI0037355BE5
MQLSDPQLYRQQAYINGNWTDAGAQTVIEVKNPATGESIGSIPNLGRVETVNAIASAEAAWPAWRAKTGKERGLILRRWYDLVMTHIDDLAMIITLENGKPLEEARGEVLYAASFLDWFSEEARRHYGDVIPQTKGDQRLFAIRQPVGVCGAIIAWNFPCTLVTRKVAPALAAGCTVVLRPASQTPLSALALAELAERAGVPAGVFNVITGDARTIGAELTANETVRKITFTGSTPIGRLLMQQAAPTVKRLSLELGGNAPFIVFEDADVEKAVDALMVSKFRNAGQTCVCANRVFVHDSVYEEFARRVTEKVLDMKVGNGLESDVSIGPLIDEAGVEKVSELVEDAIGKGARLLAGGKRHTLGGGFYEPTVLADVGQDMDVASEEIFGPVVTLFRFESEDDVIERANSVETGLAGYFFSRDASRVWRVAEALEVGIVGVNTGMFSNEVGPFGGVKQSGFGREGSRYGLDDFSDLKYICLGDVN